MIEGERGECEGERGVPFWCKRDRDNFREGLSCFLCLPESRTGDRTEPSRCSIDRLKRTQLPAHVIGNQPNDLKNIIQKRERERERERERMRVSEREGASLTAFLLFFMSVWHLQRPSQGNFGFNNTLCHFCATFVHFVCTLAVTSE